MAFPTRGPRRKMMLKWEGYYHQTLLNIWHKCLIYNTSNHAFLNANYILYLYVFSLTNTNASLDSTSDMPSGRCSIGTNYTSNKKQRPEVAEDLSGSSGYNRKERIRRQVMHHARLLKYPHRTNSKSINHPLLAKLPDDKSGIKRVWHTEAKHGLKSSEDEEQQEGEQNTNPADKKGQPDVCPKHTKSILKQKAYIPRKLRPNEETKVLRIVNSKENKASGIHTKVPANAKVKRPIQSSKNLDQSKQQDRQIVRSSLKQIKPKKVEKCPLQNVAKMKTQIVECNRAPNLTRLSPSKEGEVKDQEEEEMREEEEDADANLEKQKNLSDWNTDIKVVFSATTDEQGKFS